MLFFAIPIYNEEQNIPYLLESIGKKMNELKIPYKLVIVNDGSTDNTKEIIQSYENKFPIKLLNHTTNKNVGGVFRTAFQYILERVKPGDVIVTKEADNTSDLSILPEMLQKIKEGSDIVLASCYAKGGGIKGTTFIRVFLSSVANLILRTVFPIKGVRTYSSFYRAYNAEVMKKAFKAYDNHLIDEAGFVCMVEMLVKLSRLPVKITEVPMILCCDFRKGKSKMNKTQTIFAYLGLIPKELANRNKVVQKYNE